MSERNVTTWVEQMAARSLQMDHRPATLAHYPYQQLFQSGQLRGLKLANRLMGLDLAALPPRLLTAEERRFWRSRLAGGPGLIWLGPLGDESAEEQKGRLQALTEIRDLARAYGVTVGVVLRLAAVRWPCYFWRKALRQLTALTKKLADLGVEALLLDALPTTVLGKEEQASLTKFRLGRYRSRWQLSREAVTAVRAAWPENSPLVWRGSVAEGLQASYGDGLKRTEELRQLSTEAVEDEPYKAFAELARLGVDAFIPLLGGSQTDWLYQPIPAMRADFGLDLCEDLKAYLAREAEQNQANAPAVIFAFKAHDPESLELALRQDKCDYIALTEALNADPAWAQKVFTGSLSCLVPPLYLGGERVQAGTALPEVATRPRICDEESGEKVQGKRLAVVGAGAAGLWTALTAAKLGHEVSLFDEAETAGGFLRYSSRLPGREDEARLLRHLEENLERAAAQGLQSYPGRLATRSMLTDGQFDRIILATGREAETLSCGGAELALALTEALELLFASPLRTAEVGDEETTLAAQQPGEEQRAQRLQKLLEASHLVFYGFDDLALDFCRYLETLKSREITIILPGEQWLQDLSEPQRHYIQASVLRQGWRLLAGAKLLHVDETQLRLATEVEIPAESLLVQVRDNYGPTRHEQRYREEVCPCNQLVLVGPGQNRLKLYQELCEDMAAPRIDLLGGMRGVLNLTEALQAAEALARLQTEV